MSDASGIPSNKAQKRRRSGGSSGGESLAAGGYHEDEIKLEKPLALNFPWPSESLAQELTGSEIIFAQPAAVMPSKVLEENSSSSPWTGISDVRERRFESNSAMFHHVSLDKPRHLVLHNDNIAPSDTVKPTSSEADDWRMITDPKERRIAQNRIAQRRYREKQLAKGQSQTWQGSDVRTPSDEPQRASSLDNMLVSSDVADSTTSSSLTDWTTISDLAERRSAQNLIAQRRYRERKRGWYDQSQSHPPVDKNKRLDGSEDQAPDPDGATSLGPDKISWRAISELPHRRQDYQQQLMLLERLNRIKMEAARQYRDPSGANRAQTAPEITPSAGTMQYPKSGEAFLWPELKPFGIRRLTAQEEQESMQEQLELLEQQNAHRPSLQHANKSQDALTSIEPDGSAQLSIPGTKFPKRAVSDFSSGAEEQARSSHSWRNISDLSGRRMTFQEANMMRSLRSGHVREARDVEAWTASDNIQQFQKSGNDSTWREVSDLSERHQTAQTQQLSQFIPPQQVVRRERLGEYNRLPSQVSALPLWQLWPEDLVFPLAGAPIHDSRYGPAFLYTSLALDQIRILELLPGTRAERIRCKVANASIHTLPDYECLSYCWNDGPKGECRIIVNDCVFKVSASLLEALYGLRYREMSRHIWIDAICINQSDETEKMRQIELMRHIYQNSRGTVIWLGGGDVQEREIPLQPVPAKAEKSAQNPERINAAVHGMEFTRNSLGTDEDVPFQPQSNAIVMNDSAVEESHRLRRNRRESALAAANYRNHTMTDERQKVSEYTADQAELVLGICRRPYFQRLWVVQELCLPRKVTVQFDSFDLAWEDFVACIEQAAEAAILLDLKLEHIRLEARMVVLKFARSQWQARNSTSRCTLLLQLALLQGRACTIPSDQIFGMLAICEDVASGEFDLNYSRPVSDVYTEVAVHCIRQGSLKVLSLCRGASNQSKASDCIPSWVPDWSASVRPDEPPHFTRISVQNATNLSHYNAGGNHQLSAKTNAKDGILELAGCTVTFIACIVPAQTDLEALQQMRYTEYRAEIQSLTEEALSSWYRTVLEAKIFTSAEDFYEAFLRTTCALGAKDAKKYLSMRQFDVWRRTSSASHGESRPFLKLDVEDHADYMDYVFRVDYVTRTRSFFITKDGRLGLAPAQSRVGDQVAVFLGGEVPFLMRASEDGKTHELVGECFCHGLMNGEIFEGGSDPEIRTLIFK